MLAQIKEKNNVEYTLIRGGKVAPLFQEYFLAGMAIKYGLISPLWINRWYAPIVMPFLGYWAQSKFVRNGVPTVGKALIAGRTMGSGSPVAATYIALGTGTNAFSASDTALQTELAASGLTRANGTVSLQTTTTTNDTAQVTYTFTVTGSQAVTESGVLNDPTTGTLLCRDVFSAINVVNTDFLIITWKVTIA